MSLKPLSYQDARRVGDAIASLRSARDVFVAIGAPRAADRCRSALKSAEGAQRHADRRVGETERAIVAELSAFSRNGYPQERGQTMTVNLVKGAAGGGVFMATVGNAEGEPIYWESEFRNELQAWLWLYRMEDLPMPHNAAALVAEAGIVEEPGKQAGDCEGCGNPPHYGHAPDCASRPEVRDASR